MSAWPRPRVILAALHGIAQVVKLESGERLKGVLSSKPWIVWTGEAAVCIRCRTGAPNPDPLELDKEKAILVPTGGATHAQDILVRLLHPFFKAHKECQPT